MSLHLSSHHSHSPLNSSSGNASVTKLFKRARASRCFGMRPFDLPCQRQRKASIPASPLQPWMLNLVRQSAIRRNVCVPHSHSSKAPAGKRRVIIACSMLELCVESTPATTGPSCRQFAYVIRNLQVLGTS